MEIVVVARFVPYPGIDHAGGEFLLRHVTLLSRDHDVFLVAPPRTPGAEGRPPLWEEMSAPFTMLDVEGAAPPGVVSELWDRMVFRLSLLFEHRRFHKAVLSSPSTREALAAADIIELQWFEEIVMARRLRRLHPDKTVVGVFHDVPSQRFARQWRATPLSAKWVVRWLRFIASARLERSSVRHLSKAIVFSEKDKALLGDDLRSATVHVVHPPLDDPEMPDAPRDPYPGEATALFVAAFGRRENHDAAVWLLEEIWPRVLEQVPTATLVLAGAGMLEDLADVARRTPRVRVTGYMRSLSPVYREATVAVSPIRLGAGVKFKSVVPMLWGIPVVATSAGAEGIGGPELFYAVEDGASEFAGALAEVLTDPAVARATAARAFHSVRQRYTSEAYLQQIRSLYQEP